jgi:hypothetical protein
MVGNPGSVGCITLMYAIPAKISYLPDIPCWGDNVVVDSKIAAQAIKQCNKRCYLTHHKNETDEIRYPACKKLWLASIVYESVLS